MEQGRNFLAEIQALIEEKLNNQTEEERLELLNQEIKKKNPDISIIENLLQKGVGKKMTMEKILEKIEKKGSTTESKEKKSHFSQLVKSMKFDMTNMDSIKTTIEEVKFMLRSEKSFPFNVNTALPSGVNLIHIAVELGDVELAELLIERGADLESKGRGDICSTPVNWVSANDDSSKKVKAVIEKAIKSK